MESCMTHNIIMTHVWIHSPPWSIYLHVQTFTVLFNYSINCWGLSSSINLMHWDVLLSCFLWQNFLLQSHAVGLSFYQTRELFALLKEGRESLVCFYCVIAISTQKIGCWWPIRSQQQAAAFNLPARDLGWESSGQWELKSNVMQIQFHWRGWW